MKVYLCRFQLPDVPQPPAEIEVFDVFQTSCKVKWKPSPGDGGSPIQHYVIERQDLSVKGNWFRRSFKK
jgi:Fibronectin type III domain.